MQRIYLPNTQFSETLSISDIDIYHQLARVLRVRIGDEVTFFDGIYLEDVVYKIESIDKKTISFHFEKKIPRNSELDFSLTLYQALPNKLEKLEYIVQKCTEVGFSHITFFSSDRSQKLVLSEKKQQRLQKIVQEATEQSGRNKICKLFFETGNIVIPAKAGINEIDRVPLHFDSFLPSQEGRDTNQINIVFHQEHSKDSKLIQDIPIKKSQTVAIYVGPEGGFSEKEVEEFEKNNFQKVYLGERILRCETAGVVTGFFLSQK